MLVNMGFMNSSPLDQSNMEQTMAVPLGIAFLSSRKYSRNTLGDPKMNGTLLWAALFLSNIVVSYRSKSEGGTAPAPPKRWVFFLLRKECPLMPLSSSPDI